MKTVNLDKCVFLAMIFLLAHPASAQDTTRNDTAGQTSRNTNYSDTSFINDAIKQHMIEYKVAEMALTKAEHPRITQLAREVMRSDREALSQLMSNNKSHNVEGVSQEEINKIMKEVESKETYSNKENIPQGITGNTPNEDLGSGSSGSGNVHGEDTGTIARTHSGKENANYSEQGDYAYNKKGFLAEFESLGKASRNDFEKQWLNMIVKMQDEKISKMSMAIEASKQDSVRSAALAILPRARMLKDYTQRVMKAKGVSRSVDPNTQKKMGDDNINRKNAPR